jgi:hypothetical protein
MFLNSWWAVLSYIVADTGANATVASVTTSHVDARIRHDSRRSVP